MPILESLRPTANLRVLVAAGARGVGAAIARAFLETGSRVHVCDIDRDALDRLTADTPGITGSMADTSTAADVDRVFDDVRCMLGGLDVLINNAGIRGPAGPIEAIDGGEWERTVAVNISSHYYFARRAVPLLKRSVAGPSLIATGSIAGGREYAFHSLHASSQWAVVGLTKAMAMELGPHGIRVNAIVAGRVAIAHRFLAAPHRLTEVGAQVGATLDRPVTAGSSRPPVSGDDVAALALFLCSPAARCLTGQTIGVAGCTE